MQIRAYDKRDLLYQIIQIGGVMMRFFNKTLFLLMIASASIVANDMVIRNEGTQNYADVWLSSEVSATAKCNDKSMYSKRVSHPSGEQIPVYFYPPAHGETRIAYIYTADGAYQVIARPDSITLRKDGFNGMQQVIESAKYMRLHSIIVLIEEDGKVILLQERKR
jgi:hypothetical protein